MLNKQIKRQRRHKRVRAKLFGTAEVPRFCVFRSNQHIYGQLIDDEKGKTILSLSDLKLKKSKIQMTNVKPMGKIQNQKETEKEKIRTGKRAIAFEVGKKLAEKALEKKISKICFDRAGYKYHGKIKDIADGAREGGLQF